MSAQSSLDREAFQTLLADAFAVQESGMDIQSLSALVEIQRSIATGHPDADRGMYLIAECARNVANATGIAIALLEADQLVYRAGSGSAAAYVGQHMTAVLNVSARNDPRSEILRVENAQTDARIEAAICRQFGAKSLLILPILRERSLAGVLEVLFSEAHTFEDREVSTYRLLAGVVEEVTFRTIQPNQKTAEATRSATVPHATKPIAFPMQSVRGDPKPAPGTVRRLWLGQVFDAASKVAGRFPGLRPRAKPATGVMQPAKHPFLDQFGWNIAAASVAITLVAASWITYDRRTASSALPRSNTTVQQASPVIAQPFAESRTSKTQIVGSGMEDTKARGSAFRRVRVGQNEVDYIAEDVTIRRFTPRHAQQQVWVDTRQVNIGNDVTVHYFAHK